MQHYIRNSIVLLVAAWPQFLWAEVEVPPLETFTPLEQAIAVEVLKSGAEELKGTVDSLRHWTATATLTEQFRVSGGRFRNDQNEIQELKGPVMNCRTVDITFEWDRVAGSFHSTYTSRSPAKLIEISTGQEHEVPETLRRWTLVRPGEGLYKKYPDDSHGDLSGLVGPANAPAHSTAIPGAPIIEQDATWNSNQAMLGQSQFDPTVLFLEGQESFAEALAGHVDMLSLDHDRMAVSQSADGRFVLVQRRYDNEAIKGGTIHQNIYDTTHGFLPISMLSIPAGNLFSEYYWQYEKSNGVYCPRRHVVRKYIFRGESVGQISNNRVLEIQTLTVNEQIPTEQLALTVLEPAAGERLVDLTAKKVSVYQDGEFQAVEIPDGTKRGTWRALLFIGSGLFILGFFIIFATYEWLRTRRTLNPNQPAP